MSDYKTPQYDTFAKAVLELEATDKTQQEAIENNTQDILVLEDGQQGLTSEVDILANAIAQGGVIVNRKIGKDVDTPFTASESRVDFPVTINESNELSVIGFDSNNDHVLKKNGEYNINAQLTIDNTVQVARTVSVFLVARDEVTGSQTTIDSRDIELTAGETVNIYPQFTYDKQGDNNIVLTVKKLGSSDVVLKAISNLQVGSAFTIAGSGAVVTTRNIAPVDASLEGVNENETTIKEIFENIKSDMISKNIITGETDFKADGINIFTIKTTGFMNMRNNVIEGLADPNNNQDAVNKRYLNTLIENDTLRVRIKDQNGNSVILIRPTDVKFGALIDMQNINQIINVQDPTSDQDVSTKKYTDDTADAKDTALRSVIMVNETLLNQASPVTNTQYALTESPDNFIGSKIVLDISGTRICNEANINAPTRIITTNGYVDYELDPLGTFTIIAVSNTTVSNVTIIAKGRK